MPKIVSKKVKDTLASISGLSTDAYSAGDQMGGAIEFLNVLDKADGGGGIVTGAQLIDLSSTAFAADLILFDQGTGIASSDDNAAMDVVDSDLPNVVGVISFTTGDYIVAADNVIASKKDLHIPVVLKGLDNKLHAALVARGAVTLTDATDISVKLFVE